MTPEHNEDPRPNKDWLQVWFQLDQANLQWAKGQSWNAVQWTLILVAAVFAGSTQYTAIGSAAWIAAALALGAVSTWWQIDLHFFAKHARSSSEKIVAVLTERDEYLPKRGADRDHIALLVVRLALVWASIIVTAIQLSSGRTCIAAV
jgi:hypothetical protein